MKITKNILIEDLVENYPSSIDYLSKQGIRCIRCGEPIWGTLEDAAREKGFTTEEIENFVEELKVLANQ
jgi:methionine synthase II (cobalamin-independent)